MKAKSWNDFAMTEALLQKGSDTNLRTTGPQGNTALAIAIKFRDLDVVNTLLKSGADPNLNVSVGSSVYPLTLAGSPSIPIEIMLALLKHGANTYVKNDEGRDVIEVLEFQNKYYRNIEAAKRIEYLRSVSS